MTGTNQGDVVMPAGAVSAREEAAGSTKRGPTYAVSAMLGAAVLCGSLGFAHLVLGDDEAQAETSTPPSAADASTLEVEGTVTLPDVNRNGIADVLEEKDPPDDGGRDDQAPELKEPEVYVIQSGDTLAEISGETGVPLDALIDANQIQDPNLIFAGASLLIPPM